MNAPLQGIRVLDVTRVLAGPYCAQLLADMGADVIKVESPEGDEENRGWGVRTEDGLTSNFSSVNHGKRSIVLNLKNADARDVLYALAKRSDVLIHSFLPETGARLGLDYESLKAINPDLIFCSISGYGAKGPMRNRPGYDLMMQAFTGIMSFTGFEGGPPVRSGLSFIDMSTGIVAYGGIVTAIHNRSRGAGGAQVQASLLETAISLLGYHGVTWLQTGKMPRKEGSGSAYLIPYQAFMCRDGWLLTGATNDAAWQRMCAALGRSDLTTDERYATNPARLSNKGTLLPLLESIFASNDIQHWVEKLEAQGVAVSPLHGLDQTLTHPQVTANDMVVETRDEEGRSSKVLGLPFKLSNHQGFADRTAPGLGAHTTDILREELKLTDEEIERLRSSGAI